MLHLICMILVNEQYLCMNSRMQSSQLFIVWLGNDCNQANTLSFRDQRKSLKSTNSIGKLAGLRVAQRS